MPWSILDKGDGALTDQRTAVVLLHGIGDNERRTTIRDFLRALSRLGMAPPSLQQISREPGNADEGFSYFVTDSKIEGRPVTIASFHWADLSRIRLGLLSILVNFFQFVVDAPYVIYACLGPKSVGDQPRDYFVLRCLRSILAFGLWLIYFPIMAVNIAFAALMIGFALHVRWGPGITPGTGADNTVAIAAVVGIAILLLLLSRRLLNEYFRALAIMTSLVLYAALCFTLYGPYYLGTELSYRQYAAIFNGGLNLLWLVVLQCGAIYLLLLPFLLLFFRQRRQAILLGFATMFLVIRFWLLLITTIWLIYLTSAFDDQTYDTLITEIGGPIRFISFTWFEMAAVSLVLIISLGVHALRTRKRSRSRTAGMAAARYPRLIVPPMVPILTLVLAIVGPLIIFSCNCSILWPECSLLDCNFIYKPSEWIFANAAILLAIGGVLIRVVHRRFAVALDIVDYFESDHGHRRVNPLAAMGSVFRYQAAGASDFRPRLQRRLHSLIADLNQNFGPFDRMVFVAHSLGSMIAIEALQGSPAGREKTGRLELITLGSPYTEIFNHYFPHMFAKAEAGLLPDVARWTNIYRENDYVGAALTDGKSGVTEIAHPPIGHGGYLRNDEVVGEIAGLVARCRQA